MNEGALQVWIQYGQSYSRSINPGITLNMALFWSDWKLNFGMRRGLGSWLNECLSSSPPFRRASKPENIAGGHVFPKKEGKYRGHKSAKKRSSPSPLLPFSLSEWLTIEVRSKREEWGGGQWGNSYSDRKEETWAFVQVEIAPKFSTFKHTRT